MSILCAAALSATTLLSANEPPLSDLIRRVDPIEYKVQWKGSIWKGRDPTLPGPGPGDPFAFYTPFLRNGAYCEIDESRLSEFLPSLKVGTKEVQRGFQDVLIGGVGRYMKISVLGEGANASTMTFRMVEYITCYSAEIDDAALSRIDWPQTWPLDVQQALRPQMYIDSINEPVVELMNKWTAGKPKSTTPYYLGKELARQAKQFFQVSGSSVWAEEKGLSMTKGPRKRDEITSLRVTGALEAIKTRRGSIHDLVCLYVAACRAAGLPARPVIGIDSDSETTNLISWAEFYVPTAGWVSVDFQRLYRAPGPMNDINNKWPGFGTDDDLNERIPLAYYYHAPLLRSDDLPVSKPMLWSWSGYPRSMSSGQTLSIDISHAPRRASSQK